MTRAALFTTFKFDNTLGAALCGFTGASVVYGIFCTQVWTYYHRYTYDGVYKFLVPAVWVLETIHQAFIGHTVYHYTITNYTNPIALLVDKPVWSSNMQIIVAATVGMTVKTVFVIRVWRISNHNYIVTAFLLLMTCTQFALATVFTYRCFMITTFKEVSKVKLAAILALGAGVITDVCIAAALCYYLQKLRTAFARSNALVNSMQYHAVDTGILTSAFSLTTLILFSVNPNNFIFMALYFMLSKFYATSFLAALNARQSSAASRGSEVRPTGLEVGNGSHTIIDTVSRERSATWDHHHLVLETPNELHLKIDVRKEVSVTSDWPYYHSPTP